MRPARRPLPEGRPYMIRWCWYCGQAYPTDHQQTRYCSKRCGQRQYIAYRRLRDSSPPEARR